MNMLLAIFCCCCCYYYYFLAVINNGVAQAFSLDMSSSRSSNNNNNNHPYCINLKCQVKASRRNDFLTLIRDNQKQTLRHEPEALQYTVGEDVDTPNVFYIHEQFVSKDAFACHRETPHNAAWQAFRKTKPFEVDPIVNFYYGTHPVPAVIPVPIVRDDAYCLNVQLCIQPTVRKEFLQVIANNAAGSNSKDKEPLCLQYCWGEDETEPNTFHFHEQYTGADGGKEGFEAHAATEHFAAWEAFAATEPFTKPPIVSFFRTI